MDKIDRRIAQLLQFDGRMSTAAIADHVGLALSTTADRVKRLRSAGAIRGWHAVLDPAAFNANLCAFLFVDMRHDGEADAVAMLSSCPEVQEIHHVSGPHSYLLKLRLADMAAMQAFLADVVKPLAAVVTTETVFSMQAVKETREIPVADDAP